MESHDASHLPFREGFASINNCMHACGHDGHIAIGLTIVRKLASNRNNIKGDYYILFQSAEELIMGGELFSTLSFIKELNYFIPIHIGIIGEKKIVCGLSFLADKRYRVSFKGKRSHSAAFPENSRNALLAACYAVTGLYWISRHSQGNSRINIGNFRSDNASNIIADTAEFELDLRGESDVVCEYLWERAHDIIHGASKTQNTQPNIELLTVAPTSENSSELMREIKSACVDIGISSDDVIDNYKTSASEDATFIMNQVSKNGGLSTYVAIGGPTYGGHHNEKFDFNEDSLLTGVKLLYQLLENLSTQSR